MSEAGWTGPSARARTRTTSKKEKKRGIVDMYFTLVSMKR